MNAVDDIGTVCSGRQDSRCSLCVRRLTLTAAAAAARFTSTVSALKAHTSERGNWSFLTWKHLFYWFNKNIFFNFQWIDYLPFSLSIYKLWHSFSILSLGVVIADSRGFATDRGFLPDILSDRRREYLRFSQGEGF